MNVGPPGDSIRNQTTDNLDAVSFDLQKIQDIFTCATPLKLNQMPVRMPCSLLVYHWLVNRTKPGVTADSKKPKKNRTTMAPAKLFAAAKQVRETPHMTTLKAEYLPSGRY